jgi:uncharacterized protein YjbI with pentapeptide repeats
MKRILILLILFILAGLFYLNSNLISQGEDKEEILDDKEFYDIQTVSKNTYKQTRLIKKLSLKKYAHKVDAGFIQKLTKQFPELTHINLSGVKLTKDLLINLKDFKNLKEIDFFDCDIENEYFQIIKKHFADKTTCVKFVHFDITENFLNDLKTFKKLKVLAFFECNITDEGLKTVISHFPELTTLYLTYCPQITANILTHLKDLKKLKILNLTGVNLRGITYEGFQLLPENLKNLLNLNLSECNITDDFLKGMTENFKNLSSLDLDKCPITGKGLIFLKDLKKLRNLSLCECQQITDEDVDLLQKENKELNITR